MGVMMDDFHSAGIKLYFKNWLYITIKNLITGPFSFFKKVNGTPSLPAQVLFLNLRNAKVNSFNAMGLKDTLVDCGVCTKHHMY